MLVAASPGCGSDEDQIRETVDTFLNAVEDGKGEEACDQLTKPAQARLIRFTDHTPCPRAAERAARLTWVFRPSFEQFLQQSGLEFMDLCEVDRISFGGRSDGTAMLPCDLMDDIPLVKAGEGWRISSLDWFVEPF